jgi:hypothetical protein
MDGVRHRNAPLRRQPGTQRRLLGYHAVRHLCVTDARNPVPPSCGFGGWAGPPSGTRTASLRRPPARRTERKAARGRPGEDARAGCLHAMPACGQRAVTSADGPKRINPGVFVAKWLRGMPANGRASVSASPLDPPGLTRAPAGQPPGTETHRRARQGVKGANRSGPRRRDAASIRRLPARRRTILATAAPAVIGLTAMRADECAPIRVALAKPFVFGPVFFQ